MQDQTTLIEAILNEFNCWYRNKIVGQDKKSKFDQLVATIIKTHFKNAPKMDCVFSYLSGKYTKIKKEDYLGVMKGVLIQYEREYH